ncbi:PepSY-associated TM helix domain-containing protein [uncultured Cardiobacterium sp.]|uniref:PepSY-associated TM helix domain-containing protein n=1 Tax=uncultured Cardiobacterium sp. TaxID=417619 RepID=UPI0026213098|nr:PepSY-associated TM helix domain-containing protein [uncultured Cardiobacterium sp.]
MPKTLLLGSSTLLILLACHYLYRASPQQHWPGAPPDPARARRLAWRYALAALLLNTLTLRSGLILYLPSLAANFLVLRTDKSRRRAWLDSHNLLGITSLPFHLIIAATTVVFAFHDLIYDGMDTLLPEAQRMGGYAPRPGGEPVPPDLSRLKLPEELQTLAQKHRADYRADSITYRNLDRPALASAYQLGSVGGMRSAIHIANPYDGRERYTNLATDPYTT